MAQLVFIDGQNMGNVAPLHATNSIGRAPGNSVRLSEPGVLPRHATLVLADGRYRVAQADPGAALTVNGRPVAEEVLRHGDVISFGGVTLLFSDDAPAPLAETPEPARAEILSRSRSFTSAEATVTALRGGRRPVEHLETLYRVGSAITSTLKLSDLVEALLAHLFSAFRPDRCFILLADAHGRLQVHGERISERSRKAGSVKVSRTILHEAAEKREAILTRSAISDARFSTGQSVADQQIQSALCAPLVKGDRLLGVIHVDTLDPEKRYDAEDLTLLNAVASQAAVAVENVLNHDREIAYGRSLARLGESSRRVGSYLAQEFIVASAVEQACAVFECKKASVLLLDPKGEHLGVAASNCIDRGVWPAVKVRPGDGHAGRAFKEGRALVVNDAPPGKAYESPSFAVVPIHSRGEGLRSEARPIGVLCVTDKVSHGPFTPNDQELLGLFAAHLGVALHNARLFERATVDALTGLFSRQYFDFRAEEEVRKGGALALLMCDLDHFKDKNDVYGHPVGDVILSEAAAVVKGHVRPPAFAGRYGGEEFVVVLPGATPESAHGLAQDIRVAVEAREFNAPSEPLHCTISIGVAALQPGETAEDLVKRADQALYAAKRSGRNRVERA